MISFFQFNLTYAQDIKEGQKIFSSTCKTCHSIGAGKIVGPDLKNVHERRQEEWLLKFIPSPMKMIQSGDPVAVKLFEENNKIPMPDHAFLKESDIKNILAYIKDQSVAEQVQIPKETPKEIKAEKKVEIKENTAASLTPTDYFIYFLISICFLLITVVLYLLFHILTIIKRTESKKVNS